MLGLQLLLAVFPVHSDTSGTGDGGRPEDASDLVFLHQSMHHTQETQTSMSNHRQPLDRRPHAHPSKMELCMAGLIQ